MGAGKTTAIQSVSEIDVVSTEAMNSERDVVDKETTTVALDYGEIVLDGEEKIRLYGIPGQKRFSFMWSILKERAEGMVLLVNNDAPDPIAEMLEFLDEFRDLYNRGGVVVGISRSDVKPDLSLADYSNALEREHPGTVIPVFTVDPRNNEHMEMLLLALVINLEMRAAFGMAGMGSI
jgi:signal recognition particle receptor subunit beta